jgi:uncharacterized integral membrane protein
MASGPRISYSDPRGTGEWRNALNRSSPAWRLPTVKQALGWIAVAVTVLFVVFNLERARVWFLGMRVEMPLAFVVIASAALGALGTYAFTSLKRDNLKRDK